MYKKTCSDEAGIVGLKASTYMAESQDKGGKMVNSSKFFLSVKDQEPRPHYGGSRRTDRLFFG